MENEEKENLLIEIRESEEEESGEKEEIDYYIEEKILDFIQNERRTPKSYRKTLIFLLTSLLVFSASSVLVILFPIYLKCSSLTGISTYSKLFTISSLNVVLFVVTHIVVLIPKCDCQASPNHTLCFSEVLKVSFLLSIGSISIFWLMDGNYIRCHLEDPLKGSSLVFSLFFYFIFSRKKMSLERTFCAITIIVGVFVSVDFGLCDKFRCNGVSTMTEVTPKLHFLYVLLYLLFHGAWILHLTFIEVFWTSYEGSNSEMNVSVLSNVFSNENSQIDHIKNSIQSLSVIFKEEGEQNLALKSESLDRLKNFKKSPSNLKCPSSKTKVSGMKKFDNSIIGSSPCLSKLSVCDIKKFPITSTPKNDIGKWQSWSSGLCYDIALWQHITCWLIILGFCWLPTIAFFNNDKGKLLVDVISDVLNSFYSHTGWNTSTNCFSLPVITVIFLFSYVTLILSCLELMKRVQSAITVVSVMMPALPISSLFWSLFHMNENSTNFIEFNPEVTGEAVCAILGLPIIGIGIVLLLKSHIKEFGLII